MVRHRPNTMEQLGSVRTINSYDSAKLLALSSDLVILELFPLHIYIYIYLFDFQFIYFGLVSFV